MPVRKNIPSKAGVILLNETSTQMLVVLNHSSIESGDNKLGLPKGHRNKNEELFVCACRELKEETGILIRIHPKDPCVIVSDTAYFILKVFKNIDTNPQDNKEIHSSTWEPITKLLEATCNRGLRIIMNKYRNDDEFRKVLLSVKPRLAICVRKRVNDKSIKNDRFPKIHNRKDKEVKNEFLPERMDTRPSSSSTSGSDGRSSSCSPTSYEIDAEAEIFTEGIHRCDFYDI
jgi:8-oxo-dGTP pyrophosphatase MutT (NUDIX family)